VGRQRRVPGPSGIVAFASAVWGAALPGAVALRPTGRSRLQRDLRPCPHGRSEPSRRVADLFIAAIAAAHYLPLFTRNADDLRGLETVIDVVSV